ncbi:hypothetical protein M5689_011284 [Euphorbia peplus]|nr:hypothetical protein M5689_011284 [Euphorbia peplus]
MTRMNCLTLHCESVILSPIHVQKAGRSHSVGNGDSIGYTQSGIWYIHNSVPTPQYSSPTHGERFAGIPRPLCSGFPSLHKNFHPITH